MTLDEFREATKKLPGETVILQKKPMMQWVAPQVSVEDLIITRKWEYTKVAPGVPAPKDMVATVRCVVLK